MSNIFTKVWRFVLLRRPGESNPKDVMPQSLEFPGFPRLPMYFLPLVLPFAKGQKFHDKTMMVSVIGEKMIDKRINAIARILSVWHHDSWIKIRIMIDMTEWWQKMNMIVKIELSSSSDAHEGTVVNLVMFLIVCKIVQTSQVNLRLLQLHKSTGPKAKLQEEDPSTGDSKWDQENKHEVTWNTEVIHWGELGLASKHHEFQRWHSFKAAASLFLTLDSLKSKTKNHLHGTQG